MSSAVLTKLGINTTYHFRVAARNAFGTSYGSDTTFTTLATFATAETARTGETRQSDRRAVCRWKAAAEPGRSRSGPTEKTSAAGRSRRSTGAYFQIYRSTTASFTTISYKDCELGGAKALWWDNPRTGWEPIPNPWPSTPNRPPRASR